MFIDHIGNDIMKLCKCRKSIFVISMKRSHLPVAGSNTHYPVMIVSEDSLRASLSMDTNRLLDVLVTSWISFYEFR